MSGKNRIRNEFKTPIIVNHRGKKGEKINLDAVSNRERIAKIALRTFEANEVTAIVAPAAESRAIVCEWDYRSIALLSSGSSKLNQIVVIFYR